MVGSLYNLSRCIRTFLLPKNPTSFSCGSFSNTNNSWDMNKFSKTLNIKRMGRNNLFAYLRNNEILRYNNEPYQRYMNSDYFNVIQVSDGRGHESSKTLVKSKGINFIVKKLIKDGYIITKSIEEILEELDSKN